MSFNYPQFLWALFALGIPIIIHLFNFRKTVRVFFSNTRFLQDIQQQTTRQRTLKKYLVLAARLLFVLFLVLAFAQPFLPAKEQLSQQQNVVVYLDNSYSMSAPVSDNLHALDAGRSFVQQIISVFPAETRYQLVTNDFAPFSNSLKTKAEIEELLSQIRFSSINRSAKEIQNRISERNANFFWISDFQKSTFGEVPAFDSTWQVRLVQLETQNQSNVFVDSVFLENPFVLAGEKNVLRVRMRNSGIKPVEGLISKLMVNGAQQATTQISIEANSTTDVKFDLMQNLAAPTRAQITFADFPISFDNDFYFAMNAREKLRVVEVRQGQNVFVEKVFGNRELFSFRAFSSSNVDYNQIATADLLILHNLTTFDPSLSAAIVSYKLNNGKILIIPSASPDASSYQMLLQLPVKALTTSTPVMLDLPDYRNPFFQTVFEERASAMAMPMGSRSLDWGQDRSAILNLKDGSPFLSQFSNVFVLACPLEKTYTDFFNHALFLPVMYRIAATGKTIDQRLYYSLRTPVISVDADSLTGEEPIKLVGDQELIPAQTNTGRGVLLELPRFRISPGFYQVMANKDTLDLVAFNLNREESLLDQFSATEMNGLSAGNSRVSVFRADSAEAFGSEIKERYLGTALWKYCLILALVFLLVEVLLLRFLK